MNRVKYHLAHYDTSTPNHHWENSLLYSQDKSWVNWPSSTAWSTAVTSTWSFVANLDEYEFENTEFQRFGEPLILEMRPLRKWPGKAATLFHLIYRGNGFR